MQITCARVTYFNLNIVMWSENDFNLYFRPFFLSLTFYMFLHVDYNFSPILLFLKTTKAETRQTQPLAWRNQTGPLSPASPVLAERGVIGPCLAPLCPVINPDPLALGTVGQGSWPNPPHLLLSAMQFEHAKLSPVL